jgi:hypothetical protein
MGNNVIIASRLGELPWMRGTLLIYDGLHCFAAFSSTRSVHGLGIGMAVGVAVSETTCHGVSSLPASADGSLARVVCGLL